MTEVQNVVMPPCIQMILRDISDGKRTSHIGIYAATSFLRNNGFSPEQVVKMVHAQTDFNERIVQYQAAHVSSGATCETMKRHGLCVPGDPNCDHITRPIDYTKGS